MPPIKVNNVDLDEESPQKKSSDKPFVNNSEKEDNAIFSKQLK